MDKKFYFEPETEIVDIKLEGMLCGSPIGDPDDEDTPKILPGEGDTGDLG